MVGGCCGTPAAADSATTTSARIPRRFSKFFKHDESNTRRRTEVQAPPGLRGVCRGILKGMVKSVEGIYRDGKVELWEPLAGAEGSRVIVTLVRRAEPLDLGERGIGESQAADLRRRLAPFAEDWDRPEMAAYDELPDRKSTRLNSSHLGISYAVFCL